MSGGRRVRLLVVGTELLEGRIADRNGRPMARAVRRRGGVVEGLRVVPDRVERIAAEVRSALEAVHGVMVVGGLGPTDDDPTREAMARALEVELRRHEGWARRLRERRGDDRSGRSGGQRQAHLPAGARLLENPHGTAAAFAGRHGDGWYLALPGVPQELQALLEGAAGRFLDEALPGEPPPGRRIGIAGVAESAVADRLEGLEGLEGVRVASYPRRGLVDLRLTAPGEGGTSRDGPDAPPGVRLEAAAGAIGRAFGEDVYEVGERRLVEVVEDALREAGATVAVAESCTGGLLGGELTSVPGSSEVFWGGVVAYADRAKVELLGVDPATLEEDGAVSEPVVRAMAEGVRDRAEAGWALAITGVAGPGGGTPACPVGTVWIAVDGPEPAARRYRFPGDRDEVRERTVHAALDLLRRRLEPGAS